MGLYVHWPYCARICPYCDFNVVRDRGRLEEQNSLVDAILEDLALQADRLGRRELGSIFFGGGTPSLMSPQAVERIISAAKQRFTAEGEIEITLEANPTDAEAARFSAFSQAGVTRLSMGVQALEDEALRFLGRDHSAAEARRAVELARRSFQRLSIDLIYARPSQSAEAWERELRTALDMGFEHVSPYQLTIEASTAFGRAYARGRLQTPDEDRAAELYETTQTVLEEAGFDAYEVSNHACGPGARSLHNLHVWRGGDYLGLGPGAHGRLTMAGVRTATVAHRKVYDYIEGVRRGTPWSEEDPLQQAAAAEERLLLGLRTLEGAPVALLAPLGLSVSSGPPAELIADGFLIEMNGRLVATDQGRPVLDGVLKALLT